MEPQNKTEAQTIADLALRSLAVLTNIKREGVAITPAGSVIDLEPEHLAKNPKRKRASVSLYEVGSFIAYLKRFNIAVQTVVFGRATETGGQFKAILDYHDQADAASSAPHWGEHICELILATTPEWSRWIALNEKPLSQEQFAVFIEDNAPDIVQPDAALLLDMVQFLEGKKDVTFKSGRNLRTGAIELNYSEQIAETTGRRDDKTELPGRIIVRLMPFVGTSYVEIVARLRFRVSDSGKVSFTYILDRPFKVIEAAFTAICTRIEAETAVPVMLGNGGVSPIPSPR
jgi:uncharacterized protein YfdQ (DUF2303 family)